MGCHTDGTFGRFGTIGVMMRSESNCRPERQQQAHHCEILHNRPHVAYPTKAFFEIYTETRSQCNGGVEPESFS